MRLRKALLAAALGLAVVLPGFAQNDFRVGFEVGQPSAVIIIRPSPLDFRIGYNFAGGNYIHVSGDYRIIDRYNLVEFLDLFLGLGAYTRIDFCSSATSVAFGPRVPFGIQVFLLDGMLEAFLELTPVLDIFPSIAFDLANFQGFLGLTLKVPKFWK